MLAAYSSGMESPSIHGHDVMHMIADAGRSFSKSELIAEIGAKFGEEARFHTCSAENMDAGELVDFLIARGKFHSTDEQALSLDESAICQH
jgi:probable metal-binding protein